MLAGMVQRARKSSCIYHLPQDGSGVTPSPELCSCSSSHRDELKAYTNGCIQTKGLCGGRCWDILPLHGLFWEGAMVPAVGDGSALSPSHGTVPVSGLVLSGRPQGMDCAPGPCPQLFLAWLLVVGLFLLCPCPSRMILLGSWTCIIPYPPW